MDVVSKLDGNVQTLGLGMADAEKERKLACLAGRTRRGSNCETGAYACFCSSVGRDGFDPADGPDGQARKLGRLNAVANEEKKI